MREKLKLYSHHLTHRSYLGTRAKVEVGENSEVIETYPAHYAPGRIHWPILSSTLNMMI